MEREGGAPEIRTKATSIPSAEVPDIIPSTRITPLSLEAPNSSLQPPFHPRFTHCHTFQPEVFSEVAFLCARRLSRHSRGASDDATSVVILRPAPLPQAGRRISPAFLCVLCATAVILSFSDFSPPFLRVLCVNPLTWTLPQPQMHQSLQNVSAPAPPPPAKAPPSISPHSAHASAKFPSPAQSPRPATPPISPPQSHNFCSRSQPPPAT